MSSVLWLSFCMLSSTAPLMPDQKVREVVLSKDVTTHSISVTGWPGVVTAIRLPDSFSSENVMCADCIDLDVPSETETPQERREALERNWILERRPKERTLFLRPSRMPSAENPAAGFHTNVVVALDGGALLNVQVKLWQPPLAGVASSADGLSSDAVVTVRFFSDASSALSGRLLDETTKMQKNFVREVQQARDQWIDAHLIGDTQCQKLTLGYTTRERNVLVRATSVCRVFHEHSATVWVQFVVENRGAKPVKVMGFGLETPRDAGIYGEPASRSKALLGFGQTMRGLALADFDRDQGLVNPLALHVAIEQEEPWVLKVGKISW